MINDVIPTAEQRVHLVSEAPERMMAHAEIMLSMPEVRRWMGSVGQFEVCPEDFEQIIAMKANPPKPTPKAVEANALWHKLLAEQRNRS